MDSTTTLSERGERDASAQRAPPRWGLVVLHSPDAEAVDRAIPLPRQLTIGRGSEVDLRLDDRRLSRHHATVRWHARGPVYAVDDEGSKNGTRVDGARVESHQLFDGSLIGVGESLLLFTDVGEGDPDPSAGAPDGALGCSAAWRRALAAIDRLAPTEINVLLHGETGTGKELLARRLHRLSGREGPFVAVNCAAIPESLAEAELFGHAAGAFTGATRAREGMFGEARGGTLLLDEIAELSAAVQAKLLRVLDRGEYRAVGANRLAETDARIVVATHADLRQAVDDGAFRADLYARLVQAVVELPPLRRRASDVPLLLRHFLAERGSEHRLSPALIEALVRHDWPLNVRELRSVAQHLALEPPGTLLGVAHLPQELRPPARSEGPAAAAESAPDKAALEQALEQYGGNVAQVARRFSTNRKQVYRWLERHDLKASRYRR